MRDELFIKLLFLDRDDPEPILNLIAEQKRIYLRHMQRLTQRKYELSKRPDRDEAAVTEILIDAALFHAEADIRWINHTEQKLRESLRARKGTDES